MKFHGWKRGAGKRVVGGARPVPARSVGSPLVVGPAVRPVALGPRPRPARGVRLFKKGRV